MLTSPAVAVLAVYFVLVGGVESVTDFSNLTRAMFAEILEVLILMFVALAVFPAVHLTATSARRAGAEAQLAATPTDALRRDMALCLGVLLGPAALDARAGPARRLGGRRGRPRPPRRAADRPLDRHRGPPVAGAGVGCGDPGDRRSALAPLPRIASRGLCRDGLRHGLDRRGGWRDHPVVVVVRGERRRTPLRHGARRRRHRSPGTRPTCSPGRSSASARSGCVSPSTSAPG